MNELLPIIAELADAKSHVERAAWLKACPINILRRYDTTIRNRLMLAGFAPGLAYLEDIQAALSRTREPVAGRLTEEAVDIFFKAGAWLGSEAARLDAARLPPRPSPTDL